jgi:hypothetical protein
MTLFGPWYFTPTWFGLIATLPTNISAQPTMPSLHRAAQCCSKTDHNYDCRQLA